MYMYLYCTCIPDQSLLIKYESSLFLSHLNIQLWNTTYGIADVRDYQLIWWRIQVGQVLRKMADTESEENRVFRTHVKEISTVFCGLTIGQVVDPRM